MKNLCKYGFENYAVTSCGKVYSLKSERYLSQQDVAGYKRVTLWNDGSKKSMLVHRLVAMAYCSNYSENLVVNHKDGDKANNQASNLEWVTQRENSLHAVKTGLNPVRSLDEEIVHLICKRLEEGFRTKDIADLTGVNRSIIQKIKARHIYTNVSDEYIFDSQVLPNSKISLSKIISICELLEKGLNRDDIARTLKVGSGTVGRIKRREYHQAISKNYTW